MRSIHTTKQQNYKNNTPYRVIHKHRTKLGNPIRGIIILAIPIISLSLLSILLASSNDTYADGSVSLSVDNSDTVLELTIPESINLDLTPSSANNYISFGTVDLNILAGTNNLSGYTLTMKAASDTLTRTSSIIDGSGATIAPTIPPLSLAGSSTGYSLEDYRSNTYNNYTLNTWGYKKSTSTNFIPMPVTDIELASTDAPGNATSTTLNFAAKIDSSIPAGTYNTVLDFNIIGNIVPIIDLSNTTWYFNEKLNFSSAGIVYNIDFISNDFDYFAIKGPYTMTIGNFDISVDTMEYIGDTPFGTGITRWEDESYRTIHITGGADVTNPELIEWIQANAMLVE